MLEKYLMKSIGVFRELRDNYLELIAGYERS